MDLGIIQETHESEMLKQRGYTCIYKHDFFHSRNELDRNQFPLGNNKWVI